MTGVVDRLNRGTYVELDHQLFGDHLDQWLKGKVQLKEGTRLLRDLTSGCPSPPTLAPLSWLPCATTTSRSCTPPCA